MTPDEKRNYLSGYLLQQAKISRLLEMSQRFPDEDRYLAELKTARRRRDRIERLIAALPDERVREVLAQKYLCGKSLEEIAICMNYSKRQVERFHMKGLALL